MKSKRRHSGRDVNGILLLDKPKNFSSNQVLQKVKSLFAARRAGHTGALDPLATGMLPICLGEATKFSPFLLNADKRYRVTAYLGHKTETSDAEGSVINKREITFTQPQLEEALEKFRGPILQIPSMYSALKHQGRPLYEYARQGVTLDREARRITVFDLQCLRWEGHELELEIHCSKGTYIRTIVDDLGEVLGCGAYVSDLRRLQVADYTHDSMVTLEKLEELTLKNNTLGSAIDLLLLPIESTALHLPEVNLESGAAACIKQGQPVSFFDNPTDTMVRLTEGGERHFIGIGIGIIDAHGRIAPKRLLRNVSDAL